MCYLIFTLIFLTILRIVSELFQLMWSVCEDPYNLDTPALLQEYLVGETYAAVHKHIDSDAGHLISLLPITTAPFTSDTEYIVSEICCYEGKPDPFM